MSLTTIILVGLAANLFIGTVVGYARSSSTSFSSSSSNDITCSQLTGSNNDGKSSESICYTPDENTGEPVDVKADSQEGLNLPSDQGEPDAETDQEGSDNTGTDEQNLIVVDSVDTPSIDRPTIETADNSNGAELESEDSFEGTELEERDVNYKIRTDSDSDDSDDDDDFDAVIGAAKAQCV